MKKILLSLLAAVGLSTTGCSAQAGQSLKSAPSDGIVILAPHLAGAHQLDYLNPEAFDAGIKQLDKSRTYYIYCRSGKRSHGACLKMKKQGFKVYDMEGGILNWTKLGIPVER